MAKEAEEMRVLRYRKIKSSFVRYGKENSTFLTPQACVRKGGCAAEGWCSAADGAMLLRGDAMLQIVTVMPLHAHIQVLGTVFRHLVNERGIQDDCYVCAL